MHLQIADAQSEILPRHIFNLMRFVENHRIIIRQNRAEPAIARCQIRKEKVMVYHHNVAFQRPRCISVIKQRSNCAHLMPAQLSLRASIFHHALLLSGKSLSVRCGRPSGCSSPNRE